MSGGHDTHGHGPNIGHAPVGKAYAVGFVLAVILTVIPFAAVMKGLVTGGQAAGLIMGLGAIQILVHLRYFLHIDGKTDHWTLQALFFTLFVLAIVLGGSVWVMYHLNTNMMPMMPSDG
ncbi:cytochrome o ubiquinol oxidase subunit IV [Sphingomonas abietis]|uniref:Cytochrome bo(3) ubiquinol oxidase subunit 4 n=1 Tax=Sphingomonas abietis TaxID=3012344 RepID=A0ABY7NKU0_9SPHN|nr:cytochrome o ubiquinol oxidase subunit IV [Sphingomonas abietis]WBO22151.1 cytochrome o ubiquinol oxidase subunit IV [Sphingomonas abietis]